ncbi:MAG: phosphoenolpyruvate carboxykinase (GTP) [Thermoplasmatota archaeon]
MQANVQLQNDILAGIGGISDVNEARALVESKCSEANKAKFATITNPDAVIKIANAIVMMKPDRVWINSGSEADTLYVRQGAKLAGEEFELALPGHTCHYDLPEDQGRLVQQTFYIVDEDEKTSVLAKKQPRKEAHQYIADNMDGIMAGKTMLVSFWNRGPVGAAPSVPAIMITDSFYVVHSGNILYPQVFDHFDAEAERAGLFFTNCHSMGAFRSEDVPRARVYMDRNNRTTFSMFCTYAGNTLLLKKGNHRFTVDLCTYERTGEQLSEHMFITGMTGPSGRKTFFAGAAPSGCGKTTTAMVGTDFIGDDLAQMWIGDDGTIRAVCPEIGIFGIVRDVNEESDPFLMQCLRGDIEEEVIFSNVLVDGQGKPRWEGDGWSSPRGGKHYMGEWTPGMTDANGNLVPFSNKNARCTLSCDNIKNYNLEAARSTDGVPLKVITYSGRDSDTMPPVWVATNADEGVVIGASIQSAATATEVGATGVNRQPWANAPFVPGPLADYMDAQFKFFNNMKVKDQPIMAGLNYFLTHAARGGEEGETGLLGEKRDVRVWLSWLERRAHGDVQAIKSPIGYLPQFEDLKRMFNQIIGKEYALDLYQRQFSLYIDNIVARIELQEEAYGKETNCPERIFEIYAEQKKGLLALKERFGPLVTPEQLVDACGLA